MRAFCLILAYLSNSYPHGAGHPVGRSTGAGCKFYSTVSLQLCKFTDDPVGANGGDQ